jgi:hypothetical protein
MRYPIAVDTPTTLSLTPLNGLNWYWIAIMIVAPALVAALVAMPFWRSGQMTFGNIIGTAVIFGTAMGLILREYVELDRITKACLEAGDVCWPQPSAFTRFAVYAFIGLAEVFLLFGAGLKFEERVRQRGYAKEWQR